MKAYFLKSLKVSILTLLSFVSFLSFSQEKKDKTRIRIEQEINGKTKIDEKMINTRGLTSSQREEMIQKYQDSVLALNKGKAQGVKIEVESDADDNHHKDTNEDHFSYKSDRDIMIKERPRVRVYSRSGDWEGFEGETFSRELGNDMESLKNNLKQMGKDLKFEYRTIPDGFLFNDGTSLKTVRNVEVFPNNPKTEILNVRFNAPQKGDVSIKVMDVKGNVVAKEEIKDFSGEYVGQINIGKQKGTIFVMITQGEDGTVKRVVLPAN